MVESSAPGTSAMAAAVRHPVTGGVVGTVSVAGPSVRLTEARMHDLAPALLASAAELADASAALSLLRGREPRARAHGVPVATRKDRMNFDLTDEQRMLVDTVRRFVETELMPLEDEIEATGRLDPAKATRDLREVARARASTR